MQISPELFSFLLFSRLLCSHATYSEMVRVIFSSKHWTQLLSVILQPQRLDIYNQLIWKALQPIHYQIQYFFEMWIVSCFFFYMIEYLSAIAKCYIKKYFKTFLYETIVILCTCYRVVDSRLLLKAFSSEFECWCIIT